MKEIQLKSILVQENTYQEYNSKTNVNRQKTTKMACFRGFFFCIISRKQFKKSTIGNILVTHKIDSKAFLRFIFTDRI